MNIRAIRSALNEFLTSSPVLLNTTHLFKYSRANRDSIKALLQNKRSIVSFNLPSEYMTAVLKAINDGEVQTKVLCGVPVIQLDDHGKFYVVAYRTTLLQSNKVDKDIQQSFIAEAANRLVSKLTKLTIDWEDSSRNTKRKYRHYIYNDISMYIEDINPVKIPMRMLPDVKSFSEMIDVWAEDTSRKLTLTSNCYLRKVKVCGEYYHAAILTSRGPIKHEFCFLISHIPVTDLQHNTKKKLNEECK